MMLNGTVDRHALLFYESLKGDIPQHLVADWQPIFPQNEPRYGKPSRVTSHTMFAVPSLKSAITTFTPRLLP